MAEIPGERVFLRPPAVGGTRRAVLTLIHLLPRLLLRFLVR